jgi:hypothetical protein
MLRHRLVVLPPETAWSNHEIEILAKERVVRYGGMLHFVGNAKRCSKPVAGHPGVVDVLLLSKEHYPVILANATPNIRTANTPSNRPVMILRRKKRWIVANIIRKGRASSFFIKGSRYLGVVTQLRRTRLVDRHVQAWHLCFLNSDKICVLEERII